MLVANATHTLALSAYFYVTHLGFRTLPYAPESLQGIPPAHIGSVESQTWDPPTVCNPRWDLTAPMGYPMITCPTLPRRYLRRTEVFLYPVVAALALFALSIA
jgi:hypothetical protein